jgi:hypothetical protein
MVLLVYLPLIILLAAFSLLAPVIPATVEGGEEAPGGGAGTVHFYHSPSCVLTGPTGVGSYYYEGEYLQGCAPNVA